MMSAVQLGDEDADTAIKPAVVVVTAVAAAAWLIRCPVAAALAWPSAPTMWSQSERAGADTCASAGACRWRGRGVARTILTAQLRQKPLVFHAGFCG